MKINNKIQNEFKKHRYEKIDYGSIISFTNNNIEFKFINQRFDGWEVYLLTENKNVKLDFILEIFLKTKTIDEVVNDTITYSEEIHVLEYYYNLIFKIGLFIVVNEKFKIDNFLEWHDKNSNLIYRDYIYKMAKYHKTLE